MTDVTWGWRRGNTRGWWQCDVHYSGRTTRGQVEVVGRGFFFCCRRRRKSWRTEKSQQSEGGQPRNTVSPSCESWAPELGEKGCCRSETQPAGLSSQGGTSGQCEHLKSASYWVGRKSAFTSWQSWNGLELDPRVCGSVLLFFFSSGCLGPGGHTQCQHVVPPSLTPLLLTFLSQAEILRSLPPLQQTLLPHKGHRAEWKKANVLKPERPGSKTCWECCMDEKRLPLRVWRSVDVAHRKHPVPGTAALSDLLPASKPEIRPPFEPSGYFTCVSLTQSSLSNLN